MAPSHEKSALVREKSANDRIRLQYFSYGDFAVSRHGKKIRVETSTTHPAQIELVKELLASEAKPIIYPSRTGATHCWRIVCYLDRAFDFLISEQRKLRPDAIQDNRLFFSALSGFADADGHIGLRNARDRASPVFAISNRNKEILLRFKRGLEKRGFSSAIYSLHSKNETIQYQLELRGNNAVKLFSQLMPRHHEKSEALIIARKYAGQDWSIVGPIYHDFRNSIVKERDLFVAEAKSKYDSRDLTKEVKRSAFREQMQRARSMRLQGTELGTIAQILLRSRRTIYRWLKLIEDESNFRNK